MPWKTITPGSKRDHPSEAQIRRLYTIATNTGWSHEKVKTLIYIAHHKGTTKDLTMEEYEETVQYLENNKPE